MRTMHSSTKKSSFIARLRDDTRLNATKQSLQRQDSFVNKSTAPLINCDSGKENSNTLQASKASETLKDIRRVFVPFDITSVSNTIVEPSSTTTIPLSPKTMTKMRVQTTSRVQQKIKKMLK